MKSFALLSLLLLLAVVVYAQDTAPSAAERVDNLKMHLLELQGKEEGLRSRLQELDESIKPENIERSLAGVGSTRPEELREARRRQLTAERDGVRNQLTTLETERTRLQTELANAEVQAYHDSARPIAAGTNQMLVAEASHYQWLLLGGGSLALLGLVAGGVALVYWKKTRAH